MTIVDTSVWIDHFRSGNDELKELLAAEGVLTHPFVIGELACGGLKNRSRVLHLLSELPAAPQASHDDVLRFVDRNRLWAKSIGWIDAHLLASALLSHSSIWTLDKALKRAADLLGLS